MTKYPKNNVLYYPPGTRILWRGKPGVVLSYGLKPYANPIGYDVRLDNPSLSGDILNAQYSELRLEATGTPAESGRLIPIPDEAMEID